MGGWLMILKGKKALEGGFDCRFWVNLGSGFYGKWVWVGITHQLLDKGEDGFWVFRKEFQMGFDFRTRAWTRPMMRMKGVSGKQEISCSKSGRMGPMMRVKEKQRAVAGGRGIQQIAGLEGWRSTAAEGRRRGLGPGEQAAPRKTKGCAVFEVMLAIFIGYASVAGRFYLRKHRLGIRWCSEQSRDGAKN
ncbi:hypothetical protein U1Q18_027216 [Sarracenia purpurea var. burkii]